jgi:hypothetical protein
MNAPHVVAEPHILYLGRRLFWSVPSTKTVQTTSHLYLQHSGWAGEECLVLRPVHRPHAT